MISNNNIDMISTNTSSEDSEMFENAALDVLDLVETVCDMVGEELGMDEDKVQRGYIYIYIYIYIEREMYVCMYVCIYVCISLYIYIYICMYVCMYIYIYIYTYIYT